MNSEGRSNPGGTHEAAVEDVLALAKPVRVVENVRTFWWLSIPIGMLAAVTVIARIASVNVSRHLGLGVADVLLAHALLVGGMGCTFVARAAWWRQRVKSIRAKFSEPGFVRTRIADAQSGRVELLARIRNATGHSDPRLASVTHVAVDHQRDVYGSKGRYGRTWAGRVQWQDAERFSVTHSSVACTLDDGSGETIEVPENACEVLDLFDAPSGCAHIDDGDEVVVRGELVRDVPQDRSGTRSYRDGRFGVRFVVTETHGPLIAPASLEYPRERIERTGVFRLTMRSFLATTVALSLYAALVIHVRHDLVAAGPTLIIATLVTMVTAMISFSVVPW